MLYLKMHSKPLLTDNRQRVKTTEIKNNKTCCYYFKGYSFRLAASDLLYAPFHRQDSTTTYHSHCYTSCGALTGIRNSLPGVTDLTNHYDLYHSAATCILKGEDALLLMHC